MYIYLTYFSKCVTLSVGLDVYTIQLHETPSYVLEKVDYFTVTTVITGQFTLPDPSRPSARSQIV